MILDLTAATAVACDDRITPLLTSSIVQILFLSFKIRGYISSGEKKFRSD